VIEDLTTYLEDAPTPHHAVSVAADRLLDAGFVELDPAGAWEAEAAAGQAFVRRDGALVAWGVGDGTPHAPLRLVGAHTDSPGLRLRPHPDRTSVGWRSLGVEVYGGALWNSWLDRDLRLAGRLAVRSGAGAIRSVPVDTRRAVARVPQLAIHLDREVNSGGLRLDPQRHLAPVWGLESDGPDGVVAALADEVGLDPAEVLGAELLLVDAQAPERLGWRGELLAAGRLDDLVSVWAGLRALLVTASSRGPVVPVLVCWDHEEVGSETATGAAGSWLAGILERRVAALGGTRDELLRSLAGSALASADVAHATHPNYPERHDPDHLLVAGAGPAVKHNANARYATDARSAAAFVDACRSAGVPLQHYSHRNDLACGSTVGPLVAAGLAVETVDVGPPILSMHSARELVAVADVEAFVVALGAWMDPR
jgi:aspartyl aminopeptidase